MKAWFRGIEKGWTVYQKIGYVDRCGTIGFSARILFLSFQTLSISVANY